MNETPMLFRIAPTEFWKQIRTTIEEVVNEKINQQTTSPAVSHLPEKALLKASEVCANLFKYQSLLFMIGLNKKS